MIMPSDLTDEMVEDLKVSAENDGNAELAEVCRRYLAGDVHRSWMAIHAIETRICEALNERAARRAKP